MPMVFAMGGDLVKLGIVASLARPADHGAKGKRFGELPGDWSWSWGTLLIVAIRSRA
jgi:hypothetical protein